MSDKRDRQAGLRLLGAALQMGEFTVASIANRARVNVDTARSFLRSGRGPGLCERLDRLPANRKAYQDGQNSEGSAEVASGRPMERYRLIPSKRREALSFLGLLPDVSESSERSLWRDIHGDTIPHPVSTLSLLEITLDALEQPNPNIDEEKANLAEAKIYLGAAGVELQLALPHGESVDESSDAAARFSRARKRLLDFEERLIQRSAPSPHRIQQWPLRLPVTQVPGKSDGYLSRLLDPWISKFGSWLGGKKRRVGDFDPVVVLLSFGDVTGEVSSAVLGACKGLRLHVASFSMDNVDDSERERFYEALTILRCSTPLAAADVVVAINGTQRLMPRRLLELEALGEPALSRSDHDLTLAPGKFPSGALVDFNEGDLRRHYMEVCAVRSHSPSFPSSAAERLYCSRVVGALAAVHCAYLAEVAVQEDRLNAPSNRRARFRSREDAYLVGARKMMGRVVCFDPSHSSEVQKKLGSFNIEYISNVIGSSIKSWLGYRSG